ncbi:Cysteine protease atg4 [Marasmius crinis-equi]|uniref:Autophagy-related protein 4 n=1 Tax=Marasmius crinis-equi TaxID=585013 RepID=A0ABR3FMG6_9AGAR
MSSNKNSRHTPSPSTPIPSNTSKLPKFLQKGNNRDRSKSVNDTALSAAAADRASSSDGPQSPSPSGSKSSRKGSRFLVGKKDKSNLEDDKPASEVEDTPIIVEPGEGSPSVPIPRSRTRPDNPSSGSSDHSGYLSHSYTHTSTSPRMSDLPSRLSGWFSQTFSTSSTDLSLPNLLNTHHGTSPKSKSGTSALLTAAKHGKGHLDKAMRYLLDSDATPDKCTDPIWILGVEHKGYEPPPPIPPPHTGEPPGGHRSSIDTKSKSPPSSFRASTSSKHSHKHSLSQSQPPSSRDSPVPSPSTSLSSSVSSSVSTTSTTPTPSTVSPKHPGANWPEEFYSDFTSKVWVTYRSQFPPIRDTSLNDLPLPCDPPTSSTMSYVDTYKSDSSYSVRSIGSSNHIVPSSPSSSGKKWNWGILGGERERGWTSDAGWGCMLRTGQSLLANALIFMWLGREWRRPDVPIPTESYARYIQIVTWFLDTPSPEAPFSVHRMALAGKDLGKDVGQWFGPSTAAGAIKTLVHAFPQSGLGVSVATDGTLYQTDVFAASHSSTTVPASSRGSTFSSPSLGRRRHHHTTSSWGDRPVLLLLGIRLGLDGVNPIYYDTIKMLYKFPQSVGIAGGRPSSSYYFVGSQSDNLFYLDPHHARPAVPLRSPPFGDAPTFGDAANRTPEADFAREKDRSKAEKKGKSSGISPRRGSMKRVVTPTSPSSVKTTGSSTFSYHAPTSPSPLQREYASSASASGSSSGKDSGFRTQTKQVSDEGKSPSQPPSRTESPVLITPSASTDTGNTSEMDYSEIAGEFGGGSTLTSLQEHLISAYNIAELRTFHCERVRKMPLSGLDPSMLIGFLCKDEADWQDLRRRVGELPRTIFSIQDEPPQWSNDSDDNMGLESISDPEDIAADMDMDDDEVGGDPVKVGDNDQDDGDEEEDKFYDTRSTSSRSVRGEERGRSEEDTEEDPVDPITPGPSTKFSVPSPEGAEELSPQSDDIEDDWVDPSIPTSPMLTPQPTQLAISEAIPAVVPRLAKSRSNGSSGSSKKKKGKKNQQVPVPVPKIKVPTPPSKESFPFPVASASDDGTEWSVSSSSSGGVEEPPKEKRMHTARARDGGRTQSGGVKGILTDEWTEGQSDRG